MNKRKPNVNEINILKKLLSVQFKGCEELKLQVESCNVASTNDVDNYGSLYLFTDVKIPAPVECRVPVEGLVNDVDNTPVDILLHVVNGYISELEIVKLDGSSLIDEIDPDRLNVILNV